MSDEARMIRVGVQAARDRRTVPSFNDEIGDAIERDALAALERLESQNQALQERLDEALTGYRFKRIEADHVSSEVEALQERIEKARDHVRACGAVHCRDILRPLLSPTQETDPE